MSPKNLFAEIRRIQNARRDEEVILTVRLTLKDGAKIASRVIDTLADIIRLTEYLPVHLDDIRKGEIFISSRPAPGGFYLGSVFAMPALSGSDQS